MYRNNFQMESHFQAFTPPDTSAEKVVVRRGTRSKGCLTCRRRKVKCDEKRPHCDRCKKGYHKCLGYGQPTVFVNYAGDIPDDTSKSSSPAAEQPSQKLAHRSSSGTPPRRSSDVESNSSFLAASCHNWMITKHSPEVSSMPLIAFKESIVITYLMTKFLMGPPEAFLHGADTSTTYAVLLTRDKSAAYISGLSLAEAFFARMHKLDDMTAHSSKLYTQALRRLHQDLRNGPKRDTINGDMHMDMDIVKNYDTAYLNLWSSLFLGLYEMVLGSTATNWLQHSLGVGALTQSLGPYAFQKPTARAMLETNRVFIIIGASATRTRSFLEQPEWKTIPWALEPESKNISLLIQDAFCDIPGFMEDVDSLRSKRDDGLDENAHALAEDLRAKLTEMFMIVDDLRWRWQDEYPNCCWEKPTTMESPMSIGPDGELVFNSVLYFSHLDRAIDIIYINIILLLLHHIADLLSQHSTNPFTRPISPLPSLSTIFSNPVILPGGDTPEANAVELCRCLEYVVCGEKDSVGFFAMIYPLRVAYFHLGRRKDVQAWIVRILTDGTSNKGFGLARHVLDIHPERQKLR